ncbi:MAG: secretion protein HlyD [Geminicoccaceae bacterium]
MRKSVRILLVLLLLGGAGAAAFVALDLQARLGLVPEEETALTLYGNVDIRQVELGFRVFGRIAEMRVEEGDPVRAGDLLATLDRQPYEDDLRLAVAEAAAERANVQKLEAGTRPAEIAQARALVAERQASVVNAERQFERHEGLVEGGAVSRQAYEDARALLHEARARLTSAEKALDLALEGFRREDKAAARAALDAAMARQATAETALADTELHAPAAGVILARVREPGAIVARGETVYTLSLERPVWVRAYVPEPELGLIHPGQAALIVTDTRPDQPYDGQIGFISPVAEFTPKSVETPELRTDLVYRLRVVVEDPDQGLRQGMPVTVRIPGARAEGRG